MSTVNFHRRTFLTQQHLEDWERVLAVDLTDKIWWDLRAYKSLASNCVIHGIADMWDSFLSTRSEIMKKLSCRTRPTGLSTAGCWGQLQQCDKYTHLLHYVPPGVPIDSCNVQCATCNVQCATHSMQCLTARNCIRWKYIFVILRCALCPLTTLLQWKAMRNTTEGPQSIHCIPLTWVGRESQKPPNNTYGQC